MSENKQMLVRILTNQRELKKTDQDAAYRLMEQANAESFIISKMKICDATNNDDVKIIIFEVDFKQDKRFPGCFRIDRKSQYDTFYTINALTQATEKYD